MSGDLATMSARGIKNQTRRLRGLERVNADPDRYQLRELYNLDGRVHADFVDATDGTLVRQKCPYWPDELLWVRESWRAGKGYDGVKIADLPRHTDGTHSINLWYEDGVEVGRRHGEGLLRPSIHMPRWASRLTLEVVDVAVERLHDINEEECRLEGMRRGALLPFKGKFHLIVASPPKADHTYRNGFQFRWVQLNGLASWQLNPWVWVVHYKLVNPVKV